MKITLTKEKSADLLKLGIDLNKASESLATTISEEEYNDHKHPIFTIDDLLDLLPKWIKHRNMLLWLHIWIDEYEEKWCAAYKGGEYDSDEADTFQSEEELIDCLYELLKYLLEEKLAKI